jgi:hypothetical protein
MVVTMRKIILILGVIVIFPCLIAVSGNASDNLIGDLPEGAAIENYSLRPLAFTENQGQWDERVLFRANAGRVNMWFTAEGICYQFIQKAEAGVSNLDDVSQYPRDRFMQKAGNFEQMVLRTNFIGANPNPAFSGSEQMKYKCNFFYGDNPDQWHTDVPNYQAVYIDEIYPGIELKYYGNGQQAEYDFIISPGADYSQIQIQYEGVRSLSVNSSGELVIETEWGSLTEHKPIVYQMDGDMRHEIQGQYKLADNNSFSFVLDDEYNPELPAVIDPILVYSTYLGGSSGDLGFCIAVNNSGYVYIAGSTSSYNYPVVDPYQSNRAGDWDIFISKFSSDGSSLTYSTYLGGSGYDNASDISLDAQGSIYIAGNTESTDFPTVNPYQIPQDSVNVFVTKLSSDGDALIYSTYLGGTGHDGVSIGCLDVDASGCAYVTGSTTSPDFPAVNSYQSFQGLECAFVTKFASSGEDVIYSSLIGGTGGDFGTGIAVDNAGCAYIIGSSYSDDFPTVNQFQNHSDSTDVIVAKLSSAGDDLIYSTYLGGTNNGERGRSIAVDDFGCAYVAGITNSPDFPVVNPYQTYNGNGDVFVAKFSSTGNSLIFSTFLGGSEEDFSYGDITIDALGYIYLTGGTLSSDFPMVDSYQAYQSSVDAFITKFSPLADDITYSTLLGGNRGDIGYDIALDYFGNIYATGYTDSDDFPTINAYQPIWDYIDGFVLKISQSDAICGDANGDQAVNISDAVFIINYVFTGGFAPDPYSTGDCNCDTSVNVSDAVYIINYVFVGGNVPCDTDNDGDPDC